VYGNVHHNDNNNNDKYYSLIGNNTVQVTYSTAQSSRHQLPMPVICRLWVGIQNDPRRSSVT